jgi:hypothetical protein
LPAIALMHLWTYTCWMIISDISFVLLARMKPSTMSVRLIRNLSHFVICVWWSERFCSRISEWTRFKSCRLYQILLSKGLKTWPVSRNATLLLTWSSLCFFLTTYMSISFYWRPNSSMERRLMPMRFSSSFISYEIGLAARLGSVSCNFLGVLFSKRHFHLAIVAGSWVPSWC